jgi:hypothetical protein
VEDGESAQASKKQDELSEVVVEGGGEWSQRGMYELVDVGYRRDIKLSRTATERTVRTKG